MGRAAASDEVCTNHGDVGRAFRVLRPRTDGRSRSVRVCVCGRARVVEELLQEQVATVEGEIAKLCDRIVASAMQGELVIVE